MQMPETLKEIPALDKVSSEDLRAWRDTISTPFLAFFLLFLEKVKAGVSNKVLSPEQMATQEKCGKDLRFFQGKVAMINEVQAFFKGVEVELTNRQHRTANELNANNERNRRQRQPQ